MTCLVRILAAALLLGGSGCVDSGHSPAGDAIQAVSAADAAGPPERVFDAIQVAARKGDSAAFCSHVSAGTIAFLEEHGWGEEVDNALKFMLERIAAGAPYQVVATQQDGDRAQLEVEGRDPYDSGEAVRATVRFIREGDRWKIDLTEEFQAWADLAKLMRDTTGRMEQATPVFDNPLLNLGPEGFGGEFRPTEAPPAAP